MRVPLVPVEHLETREVRDQWVPLDHPDQLEQEVTWEPLEM